MWLGISIYNRTTTQLSRITYVYKYELLTVNCIYNDHYIDILQVRPITTQRLDTGNRISNSSFLRYRRQSIINY